MEPGDADDPSSTAPPRLASLMRNVLLISFLSIVGITFLAVPFLQVIALCLLGMAILCAVHYFVWGRVFQAILRKEQEKSEWHDS